MFIILTVLYTIIVVAIIIFIIIIIYLTGDGKVLSQFFFCATRRWHLNWLPLLCKADQELFGNNCSYQTS